MGTTNTLHSKGAGSWSVQGIQFLTSKPHREEERPHRDQKKNDDGETNSSDSLRDGKSRTETNEFNNDEYPDGGAAIELLERVGSRREVLVLGKENQLLCNAVTLKGLYTHNEEQAGHDALWDQVEDDEKWTGHCTESQKTLRKVAGSLFYYVVCNANGLAFVGVILIRHLTGDTERSSVEWRLRNETVGEGYPKQTGNKGSETKEPKIPVEAGRFAERELGALRDERRDYWRKSMLEQAI
jgi:hypothetical protein